MKKTSIIIFCYNRPRHIKKLLSTLRKIKNRKFYFVCDGPKKNNEDIKKVSSVKKIISLKKSKKYLLNKNVGVRKIFKLGLNWVFKYEKKIIILEDDIIPSKFFFNFCDKLLVKYENNKKISQIAGCNINSKITKNFKNSYFFSKYSNIWGWATWKDRWQSYDNNFKKLNILVDSIYFKKLCNSNNEYKFWKKYFSIHFRKKNLGTWDYAWTYTNFLKKRFSVVPSKNLVKNIGFDVASGLNPNKLKNLRIEKLNYPIIHPKKIKRNLDYDNFSAQNIYCIPKFSWRIKKKISRFFLK